MESNRFGLRLKELRTAAGLTQPALAEKTGLSKGGLADLEQGRRKPSWETVLTIAAALGVDCSAFQQEPASDEKTERGRPVKAPDGPASAKRGESPPDAKPARRRARGK